MKWVCIFQSACELVQFTQLRSEPRPFNFNSFSVTMLPLCANLI